MFLFNERDLTHLTLNSLDVIVCLDACFTQKRRQGSGQLVDEMPYPSTFVSQSELNLMEKYVNECRSTSGTSTFQDHGNDGFEGTLKVPTSILDG